jgi:hypothetical protein
LSSTGTLSFLPIRDDSKEFFGLFGRQDPIGETPVWIEKRRKRVRSRTDDDDDRNTFRNKDPMHKSRLFEKSSERSLLQRMLLRVVSNEAS